MLSSNTTIQSYCFALVFYLISNISRLENLLHKEKFANNWYTTAQFSVIPLMLRKGCITQNNRIIESLRLEEIFKITECIQLYKIYIMLSIAIL